MNYKRDFASLTASYLSGEMNKKEISSFMRLIEKDEEKKQEFFQMQETWNKINSDPVKDFSESTTAWSKLYGRIRDEGLASDQQTRVLPPTLIRIAATILVLLAILIPSWLYLKPGSLSNNGPLNYIAIENNTAFDLPDGSRVFLKKGSEIRIPDAFGKRPSLQLKGEAYFDIMKDSVRPFIIKTKTAEIKVLGTSFNVKEEPSANLTEVYVESGKVQVKPLKKEILLILTEGQYSKIDHNSANLSRLSDSNYLAWKTREFYFQDELIGDVFKTLEDAYQVEIMASKKDIDELRLTSSYHKQSIDAILETIALAFDLDIEKKKDKYLVKIQN